MNFQKGDTVVHSTHGLAKIVGLDRKKVAGETILFYVVKAAGLTIWIPADNNHTGTLRHPAGKEEFVRLFAVLRGKCDPLSKDRMERKGQLQKRTQERNTESVCRLIRDLAFFRLNHKINENDNGILERATSSFLNEWSHALEIPLSQARSELNSLLEESFQKSEACLPPAA